MNPVRPYWEKLLKTTATKRKNVINLRELKRQVDLFELAKASGSRPEGLLRALISGEEVSLDLSAKENDELYKKIVKIIKEDARSRKVGKRLLYLAHPFLQASGDVEVNGPVLLYPLDAELLGKRRVLILRLAGEPIVNELLFVFLEKKMKRGLDEEGISRLKAISFSPEPEGIAEVLKDYLPLDGVEPLHPFEPPKKGVHLRGFAIVGIFDVFSRYLLRDLNELTKMDSLEGLEAILDQNYKENVTHFDLIDEEEKLYPLPYDHSQHEAISAVVNGPWNVTVLQGPPGTGKTQTIANMVAQLASQGSSVLIVCRKKAALDVLKKRLEAAGVASVYVWDTSSDKRRAYSDMVDALGEVVDVGPDLYSKKIKEVERKLWLVREELTKRRENGLSLQELYYTFSRNKAVLDPRAKEVLLNFTYKGFDTIMNKLKDLVREIRIDKPFRKDWSEYGIFERDLAYGSLNLLKKIELSDIKELINVLQVDTEVNLDIEEKVRELKSIISKMKSLRVNESELKYYLEKRNSLFKIFDGRFKRAKAHVESLGIPPEEALRAIELAREIGERLDESLPKRLEDLERRIWAKKKLRELERKYGNLDGVKEAIENISKLFKVNDIDDWNSVEEMLESFEQLRYLDVTVKELDEKGRKLVELLKEHDPETLYHTYAYFWIAEIEKKPEVGKAIAIMERYNDLLKEYSDLIKKKMEWSKERVASLTRSHDPQLAEEVEKARKRGTKLGAFVRSRSRELLSKIKVWLLSPEAASELFPLERGLFDYVIIDEASQMGVEYALPSLYRAKRAVVVGDEKQLPPLLGFGYNEGPESVLELVRGRFPSFMLRTHYRSSYEELIAFSNYAFYDGKIAYAPNSSASSPFEYVKVNGTWEEGINPEEVEAVLKKVKELLKEDPERSIGIIAFNKKQRDAIVERLEREAKRDKKFAKLYEKAMNLKKDGVDQSLIVENIENIQGDERDVIIFSIVHGRDKEGKMHLHFGSLNISGGERRLNVAITRAREKVILVTSIEPEEMGEPKAVGTSLLKEYMRFVKLISQGKTELAKELLSKLGSSRVVKLSGPVERRLSKELSMSLDFGTSKFGLPAVFEGTGVESDESVFRLTKSPLEELIRSELISSRGWKVYRIWSRELWKDEEKVISELLETVSAGRRAHPSQPEVLDHPEGMSGPEDQSGEEIGL